MLTLLLLTAVLVAILCAGELLRLRYRRLARQRRGDGPAVFEARFRYDGVHPDVLAAVRSYFEHLTALRDFPVRPDDRLLEVYGLAREDVQDALAVILGTVECSPPTELAPDHCAAVHTVEDLVLAVHLFQSDARGSAAPAVAERGRARAAGGRRHG